MLVGPSVISDLLPSERDLHPQGSAAMNWLLRDLWCHWERPTIWRSVTIFGSIGSRWTPLRLPSILKAVFSGGGWPQMFLADVSAILAELRAVEAISPFICLGTMRYYSQYRQAINALRLSFTWVSEQPYMPSTMIWDQPGKVGKLGWDPQSVQRGGTFLSNQRFWGVTKPGKHHTTCEA